ncbi:cache domain-containing protein [Noviherbaspirillum saxi]|uniref:Histidine kinase n=1 Tax=Noviherbaspirillum saxi TaxID=2320863 RepID=A0A3A3FIU8_9BURK|nr:cache domain-containing protein [Noviherbaspirillum saxi]RJF95197.1 histidine kinase [Noviherbaspirillum saxi]
MEKIILTIKAIVFAMLIAAGSGAARAADKGSADEAIALVKKAVAYIKANGQEKAFAEFSNPHGQFKDRDMYINVTSMNGVNLAHGMNPKLIGKNMLELRDADGKYFIKAFIETGNSKGKGWVDYQWPNPVTKAVEAKSTYVEKVDEVLVGCGIYKN